MFKNFTEIVLSNEKVFLLTVLLLFNGVFWIGVFIYGFVRALKNRTLKKNSFIVINKKGNRCFIKEFFGESKELFEESFSAILGVSAIQGFFSCCMIFMAIDDVLGKCLFIFPAGLLYLIILMEIYHKINYLFFFFGFSLFSPLRFLFSPPQFNQIKRGF